MCPNTQKTFTKPQTYTNLQTYTEIQIYTQTLTHTKNIRHREVNGETYNYKTSKECSSICLSTDKKP